MLRALKHFFAFSTKKDIATSVRKDLEASIKRNEEVTRKLEAKLSRLPSLRLVPAQPRAKNGTFARQHH